jgi:hypothetical protein
MAKRDALGAYRGKRNLRRMPEPGGARGPKRRGRRAEPLFVIQKHDATTSKA